MKYSNLIIIMLSALSLSQIYCASGDLDITFGTNGIVITDVGREDFIYTCTVQNDGKIIAAGGAMIAGFTKLAIARYTTSGVLDTTFNSAGIQKTLIGSETQANSVALQPDGKIVIGGFAYQTQNDFIVLRYNTDGSLDTTFNSVGYNTTSIGVGASVESIAIQSNGKVIAGGTAVVGGQGQLTLAQYNSNGTLDTGFGTSGIATTQIGMYAKINQIVLQINGKIVAAGRVNDGIMNKFIIARYNANGTLDTGFGTSGIVTTNLNIESDARSVALQVDGKIVVAGYTIQAGILNFTVARFTTTGLLDTTFNTTGVVVTTIQNASQANAVTIQNDGKIIAAGTSMGDSADQFALARYTTAGALDAGFGTGGIVTTTVGGSNSLSGINGMSLQASDGKIVTAGFSDGDFALARYLP